MATPLINSLRTNGGTFYTFTSATNDVSGTFADDDRKFTFSKFMLLDLPDVATPSGNYENYIVWEGIGSVAGGGTSSVPALHADENLNFAESLQNYALNFEQLVLEGRNSLGQAYDTGQLHTVAERVFWRWLASINAIRFRDATSAESTVAGRYVEHDPSSYYRRVVKYVGDIDIVNSVRKDGQSYSECYMHVPTSHGSTPVVLFKTLSDQNYAPGMAWSNGNQYLEGRDSGSVHPSGLDLRAYYDDSINTAYVTPAVFGDATTVAGTAAIGSPKPVYLSRMNGAVVDMLPDSYKAIVDDPAISLLSEFNTVDAASNFRFNCALVYYDVYRESDPSNRATNLFGILVLDDYVNQGGGYAYIERFDKFKPNKVTKLNGNSYALKFDIKFDTSVDNAGVDVTVNEYNTFSMDLYADAMTRLQDTLDMFRDNLVSVQRMGERMDRVEQLYFSQESLRDVVTRLSALESALNNARGSMNSSTTLLDLVNKVSDNLQAILEGRTPLSVQLSLDAVKDGPQVKFDRSVRNQLKPTLSLQPYAMTVCGNTGGSLSTGFSNGRDRTSLGNGNVLVLAEFSNYFKQRNTNADPMTGVESFVDDLYVNVDDSAVRWKRGQVLKLVFEGPVDPAGHNVVIWTDSANVLGGGSYARMVGTVYSHQLTGSSPIIEVVCTDESLYEFDINVLR